MGVNAVADDIQKLLQKASGMFSENGLEALRKASQDNSLDSLTALRKKVVSMSVFKEKYDSADAELRKKILKNIEDNGLMDEIKGSVEYKRVELDSLYPDHGLKKPQKPSSSRNSTNIEDIKQWKKYDSQIETYNQQVNDYYNAAYQRAQRNGQFDTVTGSGYDNQNSNSSSTPNWTSPTPNSTNGSPNTNWSREPVGSTTTLPTAIYGDDINGTSLSGGPGPMSEAEAKMKEKARRQAIMQKHVDKVREVNEAWDRVNAGKRSERESMGFFRKIGQAFLEIGRGDAESSRWWRGRNTRKKRYEALGNLSDNLGRQLGLDELQLGGNHFSLFGGFKSNAYDNIHGLLYEGQYIVNGGKAKYIPRKELRNNPENLLTMFDFNKTSSKLDGIADWTKEHQLIVAGGIAAAGIGVGGLLANSNNKDRGY